MESNQSPKLCRLYLGLLASAISIAALPAIAQEDGGAGGLLMGYGVGRIR